ncbi:MAG: esterase-like activity of phytase family protein [Solirubrobacteraceae bacterium]|nr:esterase-like activity of phytase family protein [Solirubrobacteraceae bacterium]
MRLSRLSLPLIAVATTAAIAAPVAGATGFWPDRSHPTAPPVQTPTLVGRATISATLFLPGPISGTALGTTPVNGVTPPFAGQPIPGFSGILQEPDGTILGLPDNGFGAKANSADYLLQLQYVEPNWKTAAPPTSPRTSGNARVKRTVRLSDPWKLAGFPLARVDRQLTGADFDIESIQPAPLGFHWIGDEFGPSVLLVDPWGRLAAKPIPLPGVKSPFSPQLAVGETPTLPASGGFEAMAQLPGGRYLLPITEKALTADPDPSRRVIHQLDTLRHRYTDRTWTYRTDEPTGLVADAQALDGHRLLILERDDFEGAKAAVKKVYAVDLRVTGADGSLTKTLVADLLNLANPGVTQETPGVYGLGNPFKFALQSVESLLPVKGNRLLLASDNNFPFSNGRRAGTPDDTELIQVQLPKAP